MESPIALREKNYKNKHPTLWTAEDAYFFYDCEIQLVPYNHNIYLKMSLKTTAPGADRQK